MYGEITFSADALWGYAYEVLFSVCFPILLFIILRRRHGCRVRVLLTDSVRQLPAVHYRGQRNLLFAAMAIHTFMDILPPLPVWTSR